MAKLTRAFINEQKPPFSGFSASVPRGLLKSIWCFFCVLLGRQGARSCGYFNAKTRGSRRTAKSDRSKPALPVNYRRRVVSSAGSDGDGLKASETIWERRGRGDPTWLPWFASASGACRAPDDRLGIRESVSGSERANGAVDEPCRSRCVQNSGGFIIWRAAYLQTSAPPKPPATHGRTTVSRTLFRQPRAFAYLLRFNN